MRREMRKKIGPGAWQEHDFKLALLVLGQGWASDLDLLPICGSERELERAVATYLEAIVEGRAVCERVDTEAGAWVIDFDELDGSASAVLDGDIDVVGVTGGENEKGHEQQNAGPLRLAQGRLSTRPPYSGLA